MDKNLKEIKERTYIIQGPPSRSFSMGPLLTGMAAFVLGAMVLGYAVSNSLNAPTMPTLPPTAFYMLTATPTTLPYYATLTPRPDTSHVIDSSIPKSSGGSTYYASGAVPTATPVVKVYYDLCSVVDALTPCVPYITLTPNPTPTVTPTPTPMQICREYDYNVYAGPNDACLKEPSVKTNPWGNDERFYYDPTPAISGTPTPTAGND